MSPGSTRAAVGASTRSDRGSSIRASNLEIRWAIDEHFLAALNVAGFITGTFLQQSPPSEEIATDTSFLWEQQLLNQGGSNRR